MEDVPADWYDGFFDQDYLDEVARKLDDERTRREVDFVVGTLGLEAGARVLDLGCGHGRHSVELARRGCSVTGVDLSARSLDLARDAAAQAGVDVDFVRADARELDFDAEFDATVNFFTSVIGYFDDEADDRRVLGNVASSLHPGGSFLIETVNLLGLAREYEKVHWEEFDSGTIMLERREFDVRRGRNRAAWTFIRPDGSRSTIQHSLRVYAPHELMRLFEDAGLEIAGAWGGFDGSDLSLESRRTILRGDRPSA